MLLPSSATAGSMFPFLTLPPVSSGGNNTTEALMARLASLPKASMTHQQLLANPTPSSAKPSAAAAAAAAAAALDNLVMSQQLHQQHQFLMAAAAAAAAASRTSSSTSSVTTSEPGPRFFYASPMVARRSPSESPKRRSEILTGQRLTFGIDRILSADAEQPSSDHDDDDDRHSHVEAESGTDDSGNQQSTLLARNIDKTVDSSSRSPPTAAEMTRSPTPPTCLVRNCVDCPQSMSATAIAAPQQQLPSTSTPAESAASVSSNPLFLAHHRHVSEQQFGALSSFPGHAVLPPTHPGFPGSEPVAGQHSLFVYPPSSIGMHQAQTRPPFSFGSAFPVNGILPESPYHHFLRMQQAQHHQHHPALHPQHHHPHQGLLSSLHHPGGGSNSSKRKRSWSRAVFSNLQRKGLEKRFQMQKYITKPDRRQLAATLGLTDAQVKVWFQNRRMKWRHSKEGKAESEKADNAVAAAATSILIAGAGAKPVTSTSGGLGLAPATHLRSNPVTPSPFAPSNVRSSSSPLLSTSNNGLQRSSLSPRSVDSEDSCISP